MSKKIITIIFVVLWMLVIFNFSSKEADLSNNTSKEVINNTVTVYENVTNNSINKENTIEKLNYPVRKLAHATIYLVLSLLVLYLLYVYKNKYYYLLTIIICFIYSLTDEYHQLFINGRTGQFSDCLIDTLGAIIGMIILYIIKTKKLNHNKV